MCGDTQIQLHHTTYERVGRELLTDLTPLCARCHALVHVLERRGDIGIDLDGLFDDQRAAGYRARLEEIADRLALEDEQTVALDAEYIAGLPLDDLLIEAQRRGIDVSGELRVIRQRLDRMRGKLDAAATRTRIVA